MTKETYLIVIDTLGSFIVGTPFEGHVYSVGGCERDRLMGREIKDIDLVCDLPNGGIELAKNLEKRGLTKGSVVTYEHFGTAMFHLKIFPDIELEAVQTRSECYHNMESRNPDTAFGTIHDDCMRRDFTINTIYRNVNTGEILDLTGKGIEDIKNKILRSPMELI